MLQNPVMTKPHDVMIEVSCVVCRQTKLKALWAIRCPKCNPGYRGGSIAHIQTPLKHVSPHKSPRLTPSPCHKKPLQGKFESCCSDAA